MYYSMVKSKMQKGIYNMLSCLQILVGNVHIFLAYAQTVSGGVYKKLITVVTLGKVT